MSRIKYNENPVTNFRDVTESSPMFRSIAYFSMEIGMRPDIPTYSGGLGILAGDILKSSADLGVPVIAVTLMYHKGYFEQSIDDSGWQKESEKKWDPSSFMTLLPFDIQLTLEQRKVTVKVWCYEIEGFDGFTVPVYFLDTDTEENSPEDRKLSWHLYGGDEKYRLQQELLLGLGGVRMLRAMGYHNICRFHLNEGHAAFLVLEMLREEGYANYSRIKQKGVFTTHTPVAAGHDRFSYELVENVMSANIAAKLKTLLAGEGVSMTELGMKYCNYVNGVSRKHTEISKKLFDRDNIDTVTNGIHHRTWVGDPMKELFDKYISGWGNDPSRLVQAIHIPSEEIWNAHQVSKGRLLAYVKEKTGKELEKDKLTFGFARRATGYKRAALVLSDEEILKQVAAGKIQIIFAGKAHPRDEKGKQIIQEIFGTSKRLSESIPIVFIENYEMEIASRMVQGVDVWLNTPLRPREASGTSGMKCSLNGIMNFSTLDGWWIEGWKEDVTGWSIGPQPKEDQLVNYDESMDASDLYKKMAEKIIPAYYEDRKRWISMMKNSIALNASYFNTHRVVREYCEKAYCIKMRGL